MDRQRKPYCKEGESESCIAIAWAIVASIVAIPLWFFFLYWIGAIQPF